MDSKPPGRLSEFALIARLFAPLARDPGAYGLRDDAATFEVPPGQELVLTADALVEGVHFLAGDPPDLVARKALRVNLSDLAAKGAVPEAYLLVLSLPAACNDPWLTAFAEGLAADQRQFGFSLLGGDTTSTPGPLTIAVTALGTTRRGATLRRGGARAGDCVFVTGTIGDAGAGLEVLTRGDARLTQQDHEFLVGRYRLPEPRVALGPRLSGLATAALDVSDGLLADLGHIAQTSGVQLTLEAARVPLSPALRRLWDGGEAAIVRAATAGDDYEIAFTAPPSARWDLAAIAAACRVPITEIGQVEAGQGVLLRGADGRIIDVARPGFVHF